MQQLVQRRIIIRVLGDEQAPKAAWPLRVLDSDRWLRRIPARTIGIGLAGTRLGSAADCGIRGGITHGR